MTEILFDDDTKRMSLISYDNVKDYFVRYLWINHKTQNEIFFDNYFKPKDDVRLNVRHITKHLVESWKVHNKIFEDAWHNGDLIWRVKIANPYSKTIDYIEIWKSKEIVETAFNENLSELTNGIADSGFEIKRNFNYISEDLSELYYENFLERFHAKQNCIINTPKKGTMGRK